MLLNQVLQGALGGQPGGVGEQHSGVDDALMVQLQDLQVTVQRMPNYNRSRTYVASELQQRVFQRVFDLGMARCEVRWGK